MRYITAASTFGLVLAVLPASAWAILPAMPEQVVCPLTGQAVTFQARFGSFTTFGRALDFEPLVMGALRQYPSTVAQCPESGLPIYRGFKPEEVEALRTLVATPEWKQQLAVGNARYLVGYIRSRLGEGRLPVAWSMLAAVWSSNDGNRAFLVARALEAWDGVAATAEPGSEDQVAAHWLRAELNRQAGAFGKAEQELDAFTARFSPSDKGPVTADMVAKERSLISARNARPAASPRSREAP